MSSNDEAEQRVQVQELGGALMKLGAADATAAALLTKLFQVVAEEVTTLQTQALLVWVAVEKVLQVLIQQVQ